MSLMELGGPRYRLVCASSHTAATPYSRVLTSGSSVSYSVSSDVEWSTSEEITSKSKFIWLIRFVPYLIENPRELRQVYRPAVTEHKLSVIVAPSYSIPYP